jgi:hypothetical protein
VARRDSNESSSDKLFFFFLLAAFVAYGLFEPPQHDNPWLIWVALLLGSAGGFFTSTFLEWIRL